MNFGNPITEIHHFFLELLLFFISANTSPKFFFSLTSIPSFLSPLSFFFFFGQNFDNGIIKICFSPHCQISLNSIYITNKLIFFLIFNQKTPKKCAHAQNHAFLLIFLFILKNKFCAT